LTRAASFREAFGALLYATGPLGGLGGIILGMALARRAAGRLFREKLRGLLLPVNAGDGVHAACRVCGGPVLLGGSFVDCRWCGALNLATSDAAHQLGAAHERRALFARESVVRARAEEQTHFRALRTATLVGHVLGNLVLGPVVAAGLAALLALVSN